MIYLDNNATTRPAPEVVKSMLPFLKTEFGNPSSSHAAGRRARKIVDGSRARVASLIGAARPSEIVFTSGGTESDNWAILGALGADPKRRHIVTTRVEHEAVRRLCERLGQRGYEVSWIEVDREGSLDLDQLESELRPDTAVVSVMAANNETGILFPVAEIAEIVRARSRALFHVDGVNAAGKIPISLSQTAIDLFSLSAHKFHGPKGIGALYIRSGVEIDRLFTGGGQESGRRPGTEAVHQIAAIGKAAELAADLGAMRGVAGLRDRLEAGILAGIPKTVVNGTSDVRRRLPNTSNLAFVGVNGESLLGRLDAAGICVSTGSACNSDSRTVSPVMSAMDIPFDQANGSIRFSLGRFNTAAEIERVLGILPPIVRDLRRIAGEDPDN